MVVENLEIKCPKCGEIIDINEQISHQLQEEFDDEKKQLEIKLRKELQESHSGEINKLNVIMKEKDGLLLVKKDDDEAKDVEMQEMQHRLDTQDQKMEIEKQKAALMAK
ncbi:MAG: hypothetical protein ACKVIR_07940, partial [Candidatus Poseidoniales archaeon]